MMMESIFVNIILIKCLRSRLRKMMFMNIARKGLLKVVFTDSTPQSLHVSQISCSGTEFLVMSAVMIDGQSGTGKTWTMGSDSSIYTTSVSQGSSSAFHHDQNHNRNSSSKRNSTSSGTSSSIADVAAFQGIIPRILRDVFQVRRNDEYREKDVTVRIGFVEIYNEECKDLLHPEVDPKDIVIREDADGHIFMTGAQDDAVNSAEEALALLEVGGQRRTIGNTLLNATSSRSHVCCFL